MVINEFKILYAKFLDFLKLEKQVSFNTTRSYKLDLDLIYKFWLELEQESSQEPQNLNIHDLEDIIKKYFYFLYSTDQAKSSIARKVSCLNSFKKFLKKQDIIINFDLKRPRIIQATPESLKISEISDFLESIDLAKLPSQFPIRDKAIIELFYATGIQCSELIAIEIKDINLKNNSIIIKHKKQKARCVFFGDIAAKAIKDYILYERSQINNHEEHLFLNYRNQPITTRSIQRICKMFQETFNINKNITPRILRHSFATHMINKGANIDNMQELLGHKTRISTEKYKLEISDE